jgi:hypothetical protein
MHETGRADEQALLETLTKQIGSVWSPPRAQAVLTAGDPRFNISF